MGSMFVDCFPLQGSSADQWAPRVDRRRSYPEIPKPLTKKGIYLKSYEVSDFNLRHIPFKGVLESLGTAKAP